MTTPHLFDFDNTYARDLPGYYVRWEPEASPNPRLICLNRPLAESLGADPQALAGKEGLAVLAGQRIPEGAEPLAQAYAGHQFGGFSPRLGDGRALLLGEVLDRQGQRRDIAFKGSGRTPYSRNGDGKCALGPALREFLISEAMAALGIPTTRSLAVVSTGEMVRRERPLPGAILTRVAASHIRVGTFEYFAVHHGPEAVRQLAHYTLLRHYPELAEHPQPYLALLQAVIERQAELVARWLGVGFIHGVMNTDNMTLSGETIDFGPCAFLETYHPATVFSSIDTQGRYAYGQQADIAQWNLARLAETLLPLLDENSDTAIAQATEAIHAYPDCHARHWLTTFRAKLGLDDSGDPSRDRILAQDFLQLLKTRQLDFTHSFRALTDAAQGQTAPLHTLFSADDTAFQAWLQAWHQRQAQRTPALLEAMTRANPWLIPRNHQVEAALDTAVDQFNLAPFEHLLAAIRAPFTPNKTYQDLAAPAPREFTAAYQTFCGT